MEDELSEARRLNTELTKARGVDQDTSRRTLEELVKKKDAEIAEFNRIAAKAVHAKSEELKASEGLADASRKEALRVADEGNEEARKESEETRTGHAVVKNQLESELSSTQENARRKGLSWRHYNDAIMDRRRNASRQRRSLWTW
ncbi:unnamed protein product [Zymoseptoria tritici ST99CH_3D1]|nr:unnamed protein product [Zymoseptoria tritici ST99CH_3D1]